MEERVFIAFDGYHIPGVFVVPETAEARYPAVLLCHGFLAYKEGDGFLFNKMAQVLKESGIASLRIDFCSMGENRNSRQKYGLLQLFKETEAAYSWLSASEHVDAAKVGLIGHSLGGRVAALSSVLQPACIAVLNGALSDKLLSLKNIDQKELESRGYCIIHTSDGRSELLYKRFYDDLLKVPDISVVSNYQKPFLVVIGEKDSTVEPQIGYEFYENYQNSHKKLLLITEANHTFNAKTGDCSKALEMSEKLTQWLKEIFF